MKVRGKFSMIRTKAKLAPFMLSLSKHERDESSISPPSTMLRTGFDKLRANGNISLYAYHWKFWFKIVAELNAHFLQNGP
jgi:hypothetical protein